MLIELDDLSSRLRDVACAPDATDAPSNVLEPSTPAERSPDVRVRVEVARAMGVRKNPLFLPSLVRMLNRHELRNEAREALAMIPGALDALDQALSAAKMPRDIRIHLPRTICLFEPTAAARVLLRHLQNAYDGVVRFKVIRGLVKLRRRNPELELDPTPLTLAAEQTLEHAEQLQRWGAALDSGQDAAPASERGGTAFDPMRAAHHLLTDLVHDKEVHATQRVFFLLELIHGTPFDDIWRGLRSKNPKSQASSLELLENIVKEPLRGRILQLVGDREGIPGPRVTLEYEDAIREILAHRSTTMRTLAEYRAVEMGIDPSTIPRAARAEANPLAESLGERLMGKVRDVLVPGAEEGATRAPA
jgi:hypothetical protein